MFNLLSVGIVENESRDSLTENTDEDTDGAGRFAVSFCRLSTGVCSHSDHPANAWNKCIVYTQNINIINDSLKHFIFEI